MKKVNKFIENNLLGLLITIFLVGILSLVLLIITSNKYEDDIARLEIENKKLKYDLQTSYNTISDLRLENQECEYFIVETEDGFIIDGQLYEKVEGFKAYE